MYVGPLVISLFTAIPSIGGRVPVITVSPSPMLFSMESLFCYTDFVQSTLSPSSGGVVLYVGIDSGCL